MALPPLASGSLFSSFLPGIAANPLFTSSRETSLMPAASPGDMPPAASPGDVIPPPPRLHGLFTVSGGSSSMAASHPLVSPFASPGSAPSMVVASPPDHATSQYRRAESQSLVSPSPNRPYTARPPESDTPASAPKRLRLFTPQPPQRTYTAAAPIGVLPAVVPGSTPRQRGGRPPLHPSASRRNVPITPEVGGRAISRAPQSGAVPLTSLLHPPSTTIPTFGELLTGGFAASYSLTPMPAFASSGAPAVSRFWGGGASSSASTPMPDTLGTAAAAGPYYRFVDTPASQILGPTITTSEQRTTRQTEYAPHINPLGPLPREIELLFQRIIHNFRWDEEPIPTYRNIVETGITSLETITPLTRQTQIARLICAISLQIVLNSGPAPHPHPWFSLERSWSDYANNPAFHSTLVQITPRNRGLFQRVVTLNPTAPHSVVDIEHICARHLHPTRTGLTPLFLSGFYPNGSSVGMMPDPSSPNGKFTTFFPPELRDQTQVLTAIMNSRVIHQMPLPQEKIAELREIQIEGRANPLFVEMIRSGLFVHTCYPLLSFVSFNDTSPEQIELIPGLPAFDKTHIPDLAAKVMTLWTTSDVLENNPIRTIAENTREVMIELGPVLELPGVPQHNLQGIRVKVLKTTPPFNTKDFKTLFKKSSSKE